MIEAGPDGGLTIVEPPDRSLAGQLTLPVVVDRRLDFVDLFVPSNGRFTQDDLRLLWETGAELASWRASRLALARREGDFGRPEIAGNAAAIRDWRALTTCAHDAASLLRHWPTKLDRYAKWQPVGLPGGTEDLPVTEREVERRGYLLEVDGALRVTQSARWLGERRPLKSASLTALALAVLGLARASLPAEQYSEFRSILDPIGRVAQKSAVPTSHRDPDPSSWPTPFLAFAASCMVAIAELQSSQRGEGVVPLLDTDELYEAWLAVQIRAAMDERLGLRQMPTSDSLAAWEHDGTTFELWLKPAITRDGRVFGRESFCAVVAEILTPDLVLSASRGELTELMVLDAKSWARMLPEDALAQSAKYLYGIRRSDDVVAVPALAGVSLVTCAPAPNVQGSDAVRIGVTTATPTAGIEALHTRLGAALARLSGALGERERSVSLR